MMLWFLVSRSDKKFPEEEVGGGGSWVDRDALIAAARPLTISITPNSPPHELTSCLLYSIVTLLNYIYIDCIFEDQISSCLEVFFT